MNKVLFKITTLVIFMFLSEGIFAQEYCLWVLNNTTETLNELRVKETKSTRWSYDLLPNNTIDPGKAYWIRVNSWANDLGDLQITKFNGDPLQFRLMDVNGDMRTYNYIRLNFLNIHTLVLNRDGTFSVYNDDQYGLGHPCAN